MGTISLSQLELYGHHGYYKAEQQLKQLFLVDISFELDITAAASGDELTRTVNYEEIVKLCRNVFEKPTNLIETLAVNTAKLIKSNYPFVRNISVEVSKPEVQLGIKVQKISVSYCLD